ncbi:hypothetical protein GPJ56_001997 [Histomonas meleagridis]|uniref:uncharacterized protein n=1 Tax=Histomonas meleagridis TaxID=135588 RepID=UPI003559E23F|nr:hypothetical protein GPJ56_001997 [Histomonas meleagridis]KAH0800926.1 hypothetical protein GO595_006242 [Histomonas meleagridis]
MMAISGSCNKSTGLFFLYLFLVVALTAVQFVAYKFGGAVPQRMTQKLFILYLHYTFIPIIKKLVDATKVEGSVFWSVALFVVIFRMLLPIALQASSVWQLYKTACFLNDGEYRDYIMKSNRLHAYVSKGVKRSAYWWPFVEIVVKIFYAIFAACDQPIVACILMVLYAVAIIVIRPYDSWAFFTIAIGEALNLIIVDIAAAASPNGSTFSSYLVAFIIFLFFVPSFVALFLFIYFEKIPAFTRTYNIFEGAETDQFCGNLVFPGWILQKEETEKNEFALPLDYRIKKTNEIVDEAQRKTTYLLYYALIPFGMFVFSLSSASIFQISGANILNWRSLL